jgi:hypothetical protein
VTSPFKPLAVVFSPGRKGVSNPERTGKRPVSSEARVGVQDGCE